jgi:hypothetical protein
VKTRISNPPLAAKAEAPRNAVGLRGLIDAVYAAAQSSSHLFASPVGPFPWGTRQLYLPRFVFFGPHASDESWRLACLAGFDRTDLRSSHALLALVEQLSRNADSGHGLDVSFFPVVDAAGFELGTPRRALATESWRHSLEPEIKLLEQDARTRQYHGFVRVETLVGGDVATVRICGSGAELLASDLALITTEDFAPYAVRFEGGLASGEHPGGPLSLADDLPFTPFELTLQIPAEWPDEAYRDVVVNLLLRFLWRYRAFQAYGQNL